MVRITGADVLERITDEELINASDLTEFSVTAADRAIESAEAAGKRGAFIPAFADIDATLATRRAALLAGKFA